MPLPPKSSDQPVGKASKAAGKRTPVVGQAAVKAVRKEVAAKKPIPKELVIITGISGSGKGSALKALEDLGYYAVDNLPLELLPNFATLVRNSTGSGAMDQGLSEIDKAVI